MIRIYTGQYKNESTLTEFNLVRYTTICLVLDYFCLINSQKIDMEVALSKTHSPLNKASSKTPIIIFELIYADDGAAIETDASLLTITDLGLSAWQPIISSNSCKPL